MEIKKLSDWGLETKRPLVISEPCSAETEEQMLTTAKALSKNGINVFRAGIWKPRTRPNAFEGVGSVGFEWLKAVKQETGMMVSTEIANGKHAEEALKAGCDILWIGARTAVNPFFCSRNCRFVERSRHSNFGEKPDQSRHRIVDWSDGTDQPSRNHENWCNSPWFLFF